MKSDGTFHIKVVVAQRALDRTRESNLCNALRDDFSLPAIGEAPEPFPVVGGVADVQCKTCRARLVDLGLALEALALTTETLAARERDFAARRWGWQRDTFLKNAQDLAATYRRMAEDVEAKIARAFPVGMTVQEAENRAFQLANELHHHQVWAVANAGLDSLVRYAVELDQLARETR